MCILTHLLLYCIDIGHRLHVEGSKERDKKFHVTDEMNKQIKEEAWLVVCTSTFIYVHIYVQRDSGRVVKWHFAVLGTYRYICDHV